MNLFYVEASQVENNKITVVGDDVNHIKNVLRMREGEQCVLCDKEGTDYLCKVGEMNGKEILMDIIESHPSKTELPSKVYLFQGLPKKDKMDLIIQKTVELGVYEIIPVAMKRSIVKIEDKKKEAKKLERWQSISLSAAKQSKRGIVPQVTSVMSFKEALEYAKGLEYNLFPYENAKGMEATKKEVQAACRCKSIGIFIGPEGGIDDDEVTMLEQAGMKSITLGKRILRTETAGLTTLSILMFELEQD